jgi:16S rRNA (guanine966-N2)-methyltransferase
VRIVGGRLAGRQLTSPGGRVRPTGEEIRDRWMTFLEPDLQGARVLELFAGSGALGLEALSRGAASVDFVEWNPSALHALKANVTALRARELCRIFTRDAMAFIQALEPGSYDLVLADPPYTSRLAEALVRRWKDTPFGSILSLEHAAAVVLPGGGRSWSAENTAVTTYRVDEGRRRNAPAGGEAEGRGPPVNPSGRPARGGRARPPTRG